MTSHISDMASVDPRAQIGAGVHIGPFCVVGPKAKIGDGTRLENNVTISGNVTLGRNNHIHPGAVIGAEPQDTSYRGTDTRVEIGDNNVIRESVTINRASEKEEGITSIGNNCFLMACCHVAHDCRVEDNVIIANCGLLGGHVHVFNHVTISGGVAVHQFASIGSYAYVGGLARVTHDVPPYMLVEGAPARPRCVNVVALKRNDFPAEVIRALSETHRLIYRSKVGLENAREILRSNGHFVPAVSTLLEFIGDQHEGRHGRGRDRRRAAA